MDGSATPENLKVMREKKEQNKEDSAYVLRIIRLYDEMKRGEEHKKPKIFYKKELEEVKDADER